MPATVQIGLGPGLGSRRGAVPGATALRRLLNRAVRATLQHDDIRDAELSITLLDDDEIADMNARFLQHEGPTDVVSFALYEQGEAPIGDVYIGYGQALRQASSNDVEPAEELVRLAVHGVLHVLGHEHPDGEERTASAMWTAQESIVAQIFSS